MNSDATCVSARFISLKASWHDCRRQVTGGNFSSVDVIIPRILELDQLNRQKLADGAVKIADVSSLGGANAPLLKSSSTTSATPCKLSDSAPIEVISPPQDRCRTTIFAGPLTGFGIKRMPPSRRLRRNGCSARLVTQELCRYTFVHLPRRRRRDFPLACSRHLHSPP